MPIRKILRKSYYFLLSKLSTKTVIYIENFRRLRKIPNLANPLSFQDKLQCMKLDKGLEKYNKYVDKYEVRKFVEETIGAQYLNNLIGVYDSEEDIDFNILPNRFALKCTHGSGYNIICKNLENFNIPQAKEKLKEWLREDFYNMTREPQYRFVKPRVICEEYLEDKGGALTDYKFFCFNGKIKFILVVKDRSNPKDIKGNYYDIGWNKLDIKSFYNNRIYENYEEEIERPCNLDEMISLAEKLSGKFNAVRVDFYSVNSKTIFGELTFINASGFEIFIPDNINYELGELLD